LSLVLSRSECVARCGELRAEGKRIVFTNGCFDILHRGHVSYLEAAAALGDALVVGINSDESVRRLKGSERPIVHEEDRAALVAALRAVALVTIFPEDTPYELIRSITPDVLVKGGDYDPDATEGPRYIVGSDVVRSRGGEVRIINLVEGRSTTGIIERVTATIRGEHR
jgi:D-beta-D-heptose 7-phosphate kinase / D-beta-D-heptose 1-phosphate adenosyltransferase